MKKQACGASLIPTWQHPCWALFRDLEVVSKILRMYWMPMLSTESVIGKWTSGMQAERAHLSASPQATLDFQKWYQTSNQMFKKSLRKGVK